MFPSLQALEMLITRPPEIDLGYHGVVAVFDLDDTLYPERDYMLSGFRAAASAALSSAGGKADVDLLAGAMAEAYDSCRNAMDAAADILHVTEPTEREALICRMVEAYRSHIPELTLPDDARNLLDSLAARGVAMALITDGRSEGQRAKIAALGLDRFFSPDNIYISGERGHNKHSMEPFAYMVHRYPEARGFVYVADNPAKDFINPNLMGWLTVMIEGVYPSIHPQNLPDAPEYAPAHTVGSLSQLLNLINL